MTKYITKPVEVEAIQYTGNNIKEIVAIAGKAVYLTNDADNNKVYVCNGTWLSVGDYIVKFNNEFDLYSEQEFNEQFEKVIEYYG